jgi:pimeloyl-ACP methyl ester carboxylesterase
MPLHRRYRYAILAVLLYLTLCIAGGIFLADGTLHPPRRPLTADNINNASLGAHDLNAELSDVSITTPDNAILRAWIIRPHHPNGDAVLLLHGLGDNRVGMTGYAQIFLAHGFTVLLPDARAHGISDGPLATYGLLERNDIHEWLDFLDARDHPRCMFALGESMGAAQLLQSLDTHPRFCAIVAESSFANFREIAYDRMGQPFHLGPWFGRTLLRPLVEVAFLRASSKYGLVQSSGLATRDSGLAFCISCAHPVDNPSKPRLATPSHSFRLEETLRQHCISQSCEPSFPFRENALRVFLTCTKNIELTPAPFARTFTFAFT